MRGRKYRSLVELETAQGRILLGLYEDTPITSGNFENLVSQGFYDDTIFCRIQPGFVIQGGSPDGTPDGGPEYKALKTIDAEFDLGPARHLMWTVGMARDEDPNSARSQFFINLANNRRRLDGRYTVFADVAGGVRAVKAIAGLECVPLDPVVIGGETKNIGGTPKSKDEARILRAYIV